MPPRPRPKYGPFESNPSFGQSNSNAQQVLLSATSLGPSPEPRGPMATTATETRIFPSPGLIVLPSPHSLTQPYPRTQHTSPSTLPPLAIPSSSFSYSTPRVHPDLPQQQTTFPPGPPSRFPVSPFERLRSAQTFTPEGSSSPYSPNYPAQAAERGPIIGQKRPFDSSQPEDTRPREPPLPSPYTPRGSGDSATSLPRFSSFAPAAATATASVSAPPPPQLPERSRYRLHVRQQPRAARSCGSGDKDRRHVDPPPIVQLLMTDFDPTSQSDIQELRYPFFVVTCTLCSAEANAAERINMNAYVTDVEVRDQESGQASVSSKGIQRMFGRTVVSPFVAENGDPDPATGPSHPVTATSFTSSQVRLTREPSQRLTHQPPSTFFIFTDLSIRDAGDYCLSFGLMRIDAAVVSQVGGRAPILDEVWSNKFRVYAPKDFPGMSDSNKLTDGLKNLGAWLVKSRKGGRGRGGVSDDDDHGEGGDEPVAGPSGGMGEGRSRPSGERGREGVRGSRRGRRGRAE